MSISGYTFDKAKVPAMGDSSLYHLLSLQREGVLPGRGNGMGVSINGLTCTISTGQALVQGRLIEIASPEQVTIPANSSGHLCLTIDLSQQNSSSGTPGQPNYTFVINQVRAEFVQTPVKDDLFNGGLFYNFSLGTITSTATQATFTKNQGSYIPANVVWPVSKGGTESTTAAEAANKLLFVSRPNTSTICSVHSSGTKVLSVVDGWCMLASLPAGPNYAAHVTTWDESGASHGHYVVATVAYEGSMWVRFESNFSGNIRVQYVIYKIA